MLAIFPNEFLDYLKRSELLNSHEIDVVLAQIRQEAPESFNDVNLLSSEFVKRNLLTRWHVRQLMNRKYKGFYLRQYRILDHLGSGGMSSVYLAEHIVMRRRVAIKVLPKRRLNQTYVDRFAREARAIAALDSEHVVRAYDVDRFEDVHYIVMEYFEGKNLRQLVQKEGPLAYEDAAFFIRQAALGLFDAHKNGIVHRDVKPENIVVDDNKFVKILDLGLALLDESTFLSDDSIVDEKKILGTADYLAPEQAQDSHKVDARADIYGLGATLYFCLTGSPPFPNGTVSERLLAHLKREPTSIFNSRPDAPVDLVEICAQMMAKKPENRIQSADQVAELMKQWLIRNGFAQESDFTFDSNTITNNTDFDSLIYQSNVEQQFLLNDQLLSPKHLDNNTNRLFRNNGETLSSLHTTDEEKSIIPDNIVVPHNGGSSLPISTSLVEDLVLSQKIELNSSLDPLELALDEISNNPQSVPSTNNDSSAEQTIEISNPIIIPNKTKESLEQFESPLISASLKQFSNNNDLSLYHRKESMPPLDSLIKKIPCQTTRQHNTNLSSHAPKTARLLLTTNELDPIHPIISSQTSFWSWFKTAPTWFKLVAIGGYVIAIILAGALLFIHN